MTSRVIAERKNLTPRHRHKPRTRAVFHEQRLLGSDTLLQGRSHVLITHNGETYQLRATRLGKLILTK
jgi:hemin uptake protein HemP